MTVAFDFEDKKEEEDNSGKVKVRARLRLPQLVLMFCKVSVTVRASDYMKHMVMYTEHCFLKSLIKCSYCLIDTKSSHTDHSRLVSLQ